MAKTVIKGIDKTLKQLKQLGKDVEKEVEIVTEEVAKEIVLDARNYAPVDLGKLRQSIKQEKKGDYNRVIYALEKYAAYVEFGTGGLVRVPDELKELAIQFKGAGIREVNLPARPYIYPAFVKGRENYLKELKLLLETLTKKNG